MQTTRSEPRTARPSERTPLALSKRGWLTRYGTVGSPLHWAVQGAIFVGVVACLAPPYLLLVTALVDHVEATLPIVVFLPFGVAGAALGGVLGLTQPALLDRARGRVPLPALALGQAAVGATAGALVAAPTLLLGDPISLLIGAAVGGVATALAWLPITVATVVRAPTAPLTLALAVGLPTAPLLLTLYWLDALEAFPYLLRLL